MTKSNTYKSVGILGGIGPDATADLYLRIVSLFQKRFTTRYSSDFPEFFIHSVPLPDIVEKEFDESQVVEMLCGSCKKLEQAGADFIAMPCNTAHAYISQMKSSVSIPVLDLIEESAKYVEQKKYKNTLILATDMTLQRKLFQTIFDLLHVTWSVLPSDKQSQMKNIILSVNAGTNSAAEERLLATFIEESGCDCALLACTELPSVVNSNSTNIPLLNTIEILAEACFRESVI